MTPNRRNLVTGIVVLAALVTLAWMILQFAGQASTIFLTKGTKFLVVSNRADGLSDGSAIYYRGVNVGRVLSLRLTENGEVLIDAIIDEGQHVPKNVHGVIKTTSYLSASSSINLETKGPPLDTLASGDKVRAEAPLGGIIPEQFVGLAEDIRERELIKHVDETVVSIRLQAEKAGKVMESFNELVNDEKMRDDLRVALEKIRTTMEQADKIAANLDKLTASMDQKVAKLSAEASDTMGEVRTVVARGGKHMDEIAGNINTQIDGLGAVIQKFQSIAAKVDKGDGSAGMLVNDPRLYESLAATAAEMNVMVADLKRLVEQWEEDGVSFNLK